jgi:pimeloyl-ACP methyl ester carboxylesterase
MTPKVDAGTQWILLRGLARESRHWGEFPGLLKAKIELVSGRSARVDAIDLPGTGRYSEMRSPVSMEGIAEFAREKLMEIRKAQRDADEQTSKEMFLVAVSLGGMVASRWIERWPEDFAGCVLINTSFGGISPAHRRLPPMSLLRLFNVMRERDVLERERNVLKMVSNRPEIREETAKKWAAFALERPIGRRNFAFQLTAAARFKSEIETPPLPILVLGSRGDRMVHPSCSESIAVRWGAELRQHPNAGHDLALDDGPWTVEQIVEWWRGLSSKAGPSKAGISPE